MFYRRRPGLRRRAVQQGPAESIAYAWRALDAPGTLLYSGILTRAYAKVVTKKRLRSQLPEMPKITEIEKQMSLQFVLNLDFFGNFGDSGNCFMTASRGRASCAGSAR